MFPFIEILGKEIGTYALLALVGAFLSGFVFCSMIRKQGLNDNDAIAFVLFLVLGAFVGGHILYAIVNIRYASAIFASGSMQEVLENLFYLFGGSVFYGGLIGAIIAGLIVIKVMRLPRQVYLDCIAPVAPLFHSIARVGCFMAGCCYGIECKWGFTVQDNPFIPEVNGVSRFPVQLLEAVCNLVLSLILFRLLQVSRNKPSLQGKLIYIYFLSYSCLRFFDEFLRGDLARGFVGVLSTSQFISILLFTISLGILLWKKKTDKNTL